MRFYQWILLTITHWTFKKTFLFCQVATSGIAEKNSPVAQNAFSHRPYYKRDICKTFDRKPQTVNYNSFYYEFLRFYICKTFLWEKRFKNLWRHHNVKSMGWVGTCGWGQREKAGEWFLLNWGGIIFGSDIQIFGTAMSRTSYTGQCILKFWCPHVSYETTKCTVLPICLSFLKKKLIKQTY